MAKLFDGAIEALIKIVCIALVIYCLVVAWVLFAPQPRAERVKIAMHDEQQFKQLQRKHGAYNTRAVIYTEDGKAYFFRNGQKIYLK